MTPTDFVESFGNGPAVGTEGALLDRAATGLARRERWLWIGATLALLADVVTTLLGLHVGLAEGNPVIAGALAEAGLAGFLGVKAAVLLAALGVRFALPRYRVAIPLGIALPWSVVATTNAALLLVVA